MDQVFTKFILSKSQAQKVEGVELIQNLWSNYGNLVRVHLKNGNFPSVVVKLIDLQQAKSHPRGWNTSLSHNRKIKSYEVEINWYSHNFKGISIPNCLGIKTLEGNHCIVLEDLKDTGFPLVKSTCNLHDIHLVLDWLAKFHARFLNKYPTGLWEIGSYWHLDTRPEEFKKIKSKKIQNAASLIDNMLNKATFQTIIHGDAKLANFCFDKTGQSVAAVDFQYVGGGCGMKDVAYFLSSCLNELELEKLERELLDFYFSKLKIELVHTNVEIDYRALETEWRKLYDYAWADFTRFLLGWMPTHQKLHGYSKAKMDKVLKELDEA